MASLSGWAFHFVVVLLIASITSASGPTSIFINQVPEYALLASCAEPEVSTIVRDMSFGCGDGSKTTSYACFCFQSSAQMSSMIAKHVSTACAKDDPSQNTSAIEVFSKYCQLGDIAFQKSETTTTLRTTSSLPTGSSVPPSPASGPPTIYITTTPAPSASPSTSPSPSPSAPASPTKSTNVVPIALGVTIPICLISLSLALFFFLRHRSKTHPKPTELETTTSTQPRKGYAELKGDPKPERVELGTMEHRPEGKQEFRIGQEQGPVHELDGGADGQGDGRGDGMGGGIGGTGTGGIGRPRWEPQPRDGGYAMSPTMSMRGEGRDAR
ncbi:hypothetical protein BCR34DRAFT_103633 [Clohesyomyces aquaticus]|uniref:Extracellular membrane protein CFEM domain-containing protein n=1 Tax=Clohesyomyces aquaticus TaxID=1231657 RepID=A0A1Y2A1H4_9PLEO|nr:hypothetical protein BCR34DRAFT_103633 [Clohesyomyces aquaticus]